MLSLLVGEERMMKTFLASATALTLAVAAPATAATLATYDGVTLTAFDGASAALSAGGAVSGTALPGAWNANGWSGSFLHNTTTGLTEFQLSNLPGHSAIGLSFLVGLLDSWDSTNGSPAPDYLFIYVDGVQVAQLTANNASGGFSDYGGGTLLYSGVQIDTNQSYSDRLLDMSSAGWASFAHSGSTLTLGFQAGGAGWQGGTDESWGVDNLTISYTPDATGAVPEPASWAMMIGGLGLAGGMLRRRRAAIGIA